MWRKEYQNWKTSRLRFRIALTEAVGAPLPQFTVKALIKRLQQEVRARGGKDNRFVPEVMAKEYKLTLCGKLLPKGVDETYVDRVFEEIAQELTTRYHSWNELKSDLLGACEAVDTALRGFGDFPSLASMAAQAASHKLPKDSTIVFDPQLPFIDVQKIGVDAMPYAVVSALLSYPESVGEQRREFVQSHLTTASAAGLSWLFNRGLELFSEESVEELCRLFQVPEDQAFRVTQIQNAARMTPKQSFFLKKGGTPLGYHDFRSAFAGRINSWTANYLNRLEELQGLLHDLTDELRLPDLVREGEDFLVTTDCRREEAEVLCCSFAMKRDRAKTAVEHLLGADPIQVANDVAAIEECSRIVNRLYAIREQIVNALRQAEDDKASRWNTLWSEVKAEFAPWEKLIRLPKLNGMSGGVPPAQDELETILARYSDVGRGASEHFDAVMEWAAKTGAEGDVLKKFAETEQQRADQRAPGKYDGRELALRLVLQRVARVVRDRSDACAEDVRQWFLKENVFAERKDFNKFFSNRLGSLYVSPFSNRRHEGYKLTAGLTERSDAVWNALLAFVKEKKDAMIDMAASTALDKFAREFVNRYLEGILELQNIKIEQKRPILTFTLAGIPGQVHTAEVHRIDISEDGHKLSLANFKSNTLCIENALNRFVPKTIDISDDTAAMALAVGAGFNLLVCAEFAALASAVTIQKIGQTGTAAGEEMIRLFCENF